jgi:hypothetical protein
MPVSRTYQENSHAKNNMMTHETSKDFCHRLNFMEKFSVANSERAEGNGTMIGKDHFSCMLDRTGRIMPRCGKDELLVLS